MLNNVSEQICQAIDVIVSKKIENLPYNTTKICTIINDTDKRIGLYRVSDGSANFDAYSESSEYKVNDRVRVSIENNDATKKKYIIGKYIPNDINSVLVATTPMDTIVPMVDNLFVHNGPAFGLTTNNQEESEIGVGSVASPIEDSQIYNTLYIKANFQSNLDNYDMRSGEYGLRLVLTYLKEGQTGKADLTLSSANMNGNPYSLLTFSTQSGTYDISELGIIQSIAITFYQDNNFTYWNGDTQKLESVNINKEIKNLFVQDITIGLGVELSQVEDNTLQLYSNDSPTYSGEDSSVLENQKDVRLAWYNKSDTNAAIGFNDGIYDLNYDEQEFWEAKQEYSELAEQLIHDVPTDKNGLTCSRDGAQVLSNFNKVINYFENKGDVDKLLQSFVSNAKPFFDNNIIDEKPFYDYYITDGLDKIRQDFVKTAAPIRELALKFYDDVLGYAREIQDNGKDVTINDENLAEYVLKTYFTLGTSEYLKLNEQFRNNWNSYKSEWDKISSQLENSIKTNNNSIFYQEFNKKIQGIFKDIENLLNDVDKIYGVLAENYYDFEKRLKQFFAPDYEFDVFLSEFNLNDYANKYCIYWYRYNPNVEVINEFEKTYITGNWERMNNYTNFGLPTLSTDKNGIKYYVSTPTVKESTIYDIPMNISLKKEQFLVILFYNHEFYKSNILEFTNKYFVTEDSSLSSQSTISIVNDTNSQDIYQSYGENNQLLNITDGVSRRRIKLNYSGATGEGDQFMCGAQVFWYVPLSSTMIKYNLNDLEGFSYDIGENVGSTEHSKEGYACFYKTIPAYEGTLTEEQKQELYNSLTFVYTIKDTFEKTNNNTIKCKIILNGYTYYPEKTFIFSTFGNSGTDYTFLLSPTSSLIAEAVYDDRPLELEVALTDAAGNNIDVYYSSIDLSGQFTYATGLKNFKIIPKDRNSSETYSPYYVEFYTKDWLQITDTENKDKVVKFIKIKKYNKLDKRYCGILQLDMDLYEATSENASAKITTLTYTYPITYLSNIKYSIEGPDTIIYDSFGTNPTYTKTAYKINNTSIDDAKWIIQYYNNRGELLEADKVNKKYLPNFLEGTNTLQLPELFISDENIYCVVECVSGSTNEILAARPLNILQNKYPIPTINHWSGEVNVNQENGTITSAMMAAGCKSVDNKFTGVIFGEVRDNNDKSISKSGIYGFKDGLQSFGFLNDGTGFIGTSGAGRIRFDGQSSYIESGEYPVNGSGMRLTLKDGVISMKNPNGPGQIEISAIHNQYPLRIGQGRVTDSDGSIRENWNFVVNWDGTIEATGTINATSGTIGSDVDTASLTIGTNQIIDGSVITAKLTDKAVTTDKINDSAINSSKINNGSIKNSHLATDFILSTDQVQLVKADGTRAYLTTVLEDYENRIAELERQLQDSEFTSKVDAILTAHGLI